MTDRSRNGYDRPAQFVAGSTAHKPSRTQRPIRRDQYDWIYRWLVLIAIFASLGAMLGWRG